jgi:antirestriction protein
MAIIGGRNPIHKIEFEMLPQIMDLGDGSIGTSFHSRTRMHVTCGKCHKKYADCPECPYCGEPTYIKKRMMDAAEIDIAEAAGIDPTNVDNWDLIEGIASVARKHYSDY